MAPAELVAHARRRGLVGLALTDHDTVAGLAEAQQAAEAIDGFTFVPGIEVSAACPAGTLHILGLRIDADAPALADLTSQLIAMREQRNPRMVAALAAHGLDLTMEEVASLATPDVEGKRLVSRAHMAELLVRKRYAADYREAFRRWLGPGAPTYVEKDRLPPGQAFDAIHRAGGLALLAHPFQIGFDNFAQCERAVRDLVDQGLDGVEAYHSDHNDVQTRFLLDLARHRDLAVCGGSDFHGSSKQHVRLGVPPVPAWVMDDLLDRARAPRPARPR